MHTRPGTIVVGVDGSTHSTRALDWAVQQAEVEHRALTLVYTIHSVTPAFMDAAISDARSAQSVLEAAGQQVLSEARARVQSKSPDLEVHEAFDLADPRETLRQMSQDAAMLVVGSRGHGQVRSLLLGSVSVYLVRHAHCPVIVVRPENVGKVRHGVVVGADGAPGSRAVLEFAYREASLRGLPLTVVVCVWDIAAGTMGASMVSDPPTDLEGERVALAESMAGMSEKYPDVHVTTTMARGVPQETLVRLGDRMNLIVVGAHQNSRLSQAFFGSVSVAVVENATAPVAVVPLSQSLSQSR
jgi:nucleotide-binding universal stress UspA family protein